MIAITTRLIATPEVKGRNSTFQAIALKMGKGSVSNYYYLSY